MQRRSLCLSIGFPVFLDKTTNYSRINTKPHNIKDKTSRNEYEQKFHIILVEVVEEKYGKYCENAEKVQKMVFLEHEY